MKVTLVKSSSNGEMEPELAIFYNRTFDLKSVLPAICARVMMAQNLWRWPTKDWSNLRPTPQRNPCLTLPKWSGTRSSTAQGPRAEPNMTGKERENKMIPNDMCYIHRMVPNPFVIKGVSSTKWWSRYRDTQLNIRQRQWTPQKEWGIQHGQKPLEFLF